MALYPAPMPIAIPHFGDLTAWAISTHYSVGQRVLANGNVYQATIEGISSGVGTGPIGTGGAISDGTVTWAYQASAAPAWVGGTVYAVGDIVTNDGGHVYQCITAGTSDLYGTGPTGTAGVIADGTATWSYAGSVVALQTQPTSRTADSGAVPGAPLFAQYLNYVFALIVAWLYYVRDLAKQPMQWQQGHQFTNENDHVIPLIDTGMDQQAGREQRGGFDWMGFGDYDHFRLQENWTHYASIGGASVPVALSTGSHWNVETNGGAGSGVSGVAVSAGSGDAHGVGSSSFISPGTVAGQDAYIMLGTTGGAPVFSTASYDDESQSVAEAVAYLQRLSGIGTVGDDATVSFGFCAAGGTPTFPTANGKQIAFRKKRTDTNWQAVVGDGTSETVVDTGQAPVENVAQRLRVEYHGAGSYSGAKICRFFINGSLVAEISTHIPTSQAMRFGFGPHYVGTGTSNTAIYVGPTLVKRSVLPELAT